MERLANEGKIPLGEIADSAMDQLGAPARGAVGEVMRLQQRGAIPSRRRIDRCSQAGRAAANHQDVPYLPGTKPIEVLLAGQ